MLEHRERKGPAAPEPCRPTHMAFRTHALIASGFAVRQDSLRSGKLGLANGAAMPQLL